MRLRPKPCGGVQSVKVAACSRWLWAPSTTTCSMPRTTSAPTAWPSAGLHVSRTSCAVSVSERTQVTRYITLEQGLRIARLAMGAPIQVRDLGLLEAALHRPRTSVFGQDAYPDLYSKAAALLHSIVA